MRDAYANGNGVVNLKSQMNYADAYYAAGFDKGGNTSYYNTITTAFNDGWQVIADANREKLTNAQRREVKRHARTICSNWEKVIAEVVFKYAGSVYSNIEAAKATMGGNMWQVKGSTEQAEHEAALRKYAKYWDELAGFSLSLHTSGVDLGEIGVKMDRLVGMGPVMPDGTQVNGMSNGPYTLASGKSMDGFPFTCSSSRTLWSRNSLSRLAITIKSPPFQIWQRFRVRATAPKTTDFCTDVRVATGAPPPVADLFQE